MPLTPLQQVDQGSREYFARALFESFRLQPWHLVVTIVAGGEDAFVRIAQEQCANQDLWRSDYEHVYAAHCSIVERGGWPALPEVGRV